MSLKLYIKKGIKYIGWGRISNNKCLLQSVSNMIVTGRIEERLKDACEKLKELDCKGQALCLRMDNRWVYAFPTHFDSILQGEWERKE